MLTIPVGAVQVSRTDANLSKLLAPNSLYWRNIGKTTLFKVADFCHHFWSRKKKVTKTSTEFLDKNKLNFFLSKMQIDLDLLEKDIT